MCTALTEPSVIPTLLTGYNPAWQLLPTTILTDKPMLFSNSMEVCLGGLMLQITEVTQKQGKILWLNKNDPERIHTVFSTYK